MSASPGSAARGARRARAAAPAKPASHACAVQAPSVRGVRFQVFRQFNTPELARFAGSRTRLRARAAELFSGPRLEYRIVRALAEREALPLKEICEAFEFFERARRALRAPIVADLCCGHGLVGLLFAVFERSLEQVLLIDEREPESHARVRAALAEVAPWAVPKARFLELPLKRALPALPSGAAIAAVHACGVRSDRAIDAALATAGALALLPCCYEGSAKEVPGALRAALGVPLACDVERTYRLHRAGYRVRWSAIPEAVSPMNRMLLATRA